MHRILFSTNINKIELINVLADLTIRSFIIQKNTNKSFLSSRF
jgi:hypothetical protein